MTNSEKIVDCLFGSLAGFFLFDFDFVGKKNNFQDE